MDQSAIVSTNQAEVANNDRIEILMRPVMLFVLQQHNLQHLQLAMKQALRRAACRVYAMQALNWLLRSVTQPICLHDLLWWFVSSLTPVISSDSTDANEDDNRTEKKEDHVSEINFQIKIYSLMYNLCHLLDLLDPFALTWLIKLYSIFRILSVSASIL